MTLAPDQPLQHVWPPVFRDIDADGRPAETKEILHLLAGDEWRSYYDLAEPK